MNHVYTVVVQHFYMRNGFYYQIDEDCPCYKIYASEWPAIDYAIKLAKDFEKKEGQKRKTIRVTTTNYTKIQVLNKEDFGVWPEMSITIREQHVN